MFNLIAVKPSKLEISRADLLNYLNEGERNRLSKIQREKTAREFLISRFLLKKGLTYNLEVPLSQLKLLYDDEFIPQAENLNFSLSHTRDMQLLFIGDKYRVGIDLEPLGKLKTIDVAHQFLTASEILQMDELENLDRQLVFALQLWTLKEAYLKATRLAGIHAFNKLDFNIERELISLNNKDLPKAYFQSFEYSSYQVAICQLNQPLGKIKLQVLNGENDFEIITKDLRRFLV